MRENIFSHFFIIRRNVIMNYQKKIEKITREEQNWTNQKKYLNKKIELKKDKELFLLKNKKKISTSKILILFLFINCTVIEIFTGWVTIKSFSYSLMTGNAIDFSPLVTLIGAVVGEVIGFAIYSLKSTKENTAGGVVYDSIFRDKDSINDDPQG